jgi:hypothetical protein
MASIPQASVAAITRRLASQAKVGRRHFWAPVVVADIPLKSGCLDVARTPSYGGRRQYTPLSQVKQETLSARKIRNDPLSMAIRWSSTDGAMKMAGEGDETTATAEEVLASATNPSIFGSGLVEDDLKSWAETPSVLDSLPEGFGAGDAQRALDQKGAKAHGRRPIRRTEVWRLCQAARQGYHRDAACLLASLRAYKRLHKAVYTDWQAKAGLEGMVRALTPIDASTFVSPKEGRNPMYPIRIDDTTGDEFHMQRIYADIFAIRAILDETTGLITAVNSDDVDALVADLLQSVQALPDVSKLDDYSVRVFPRITKVDEFASNLPRWKIVRLTQQLTHAMIYRAVRPQRFMKKRAARKYLKQVMRDDAPHPSTIHSACQICMLLGSSAEADVGILSEYMNVPLWGEPLKETLQLLDETREKEKVARKDEEERQKAEAAAAELATAEAEAAEAAELAAAEAKEAAAAELAASEAEEAAAETESDEPGSVDSDSSSDEPNETSSSEKSD